MVPVPTTPTPDLETRETLRRVLGREAAAGERKIAVLGLGLALVGLGFCVVVLVFVNRRLGAWLSLVPLAYALWYATVLAILRRGHPSWLGWVSSSLEVSVATIIGVIDAALQSPEYALTSAPPLLYFIAIAMTSLRFRRRLTVYAGLLGGAQIAVFYSFMLGRLPPELLTALPSLQPAVYLQRVVYVVAAGLFFAVISGTVLRLAQTMVGEVEARQRLRRLLGRYVPEEVVDRALIEGIPTSGQRREVTVLCADVRDFVAWSSSRPPEEVVRFVNALFGRQYEIIARHGGWVDKFLGDGMLAIFGAPMAHGDAVGAAAAAALEIVALSESAMAEGPDPLQLGVALHTGPVVIGNIGAPERFEYTAIGDTVNLAFRLEGLNRRLGTTSVLSEATRLALGNRAVVRPNPPTRIRGQDQEVRTFALLGLRGDGEGDQRNSEFRGHVSIRPSTRLPASSAES